MRKIGLVICFIFFLSKTTIGQGEGTIKKVARFYSLTEKINSLSKDVDSSTINELFLYSDSLPVEIITTSCFKNLVFGQVGVPFGELEKDKVKDFFVKPARKREAELFGKRFYMWDGYVMVYFAFDNESFKFYKLTGFKNYDVLELVEDLKSKKVIKNRKDFFKKSSCVKEIDFALLIRNNDKSYLYSVLRPIEVSISSDKRGKDTIKINPSKQNRE